MLGWIRVLLIGSIGLIGLVKLVLLLYRVLAHSIYCLTKRIIELKNRYGSTNSGSSDFPPILKVITPFFVFMIKKYPK